jgi:ABC-type branched-subunit amino acid transport system ATPase component
LIRLIRLKSGATKAAAPLAFEPGPLTVVVGPNNAGKSLLLRELEAWTLPGAPFDGLILNGVQLRQFDEIEASTLVEHRINEFDNQRAPTGHVLVTVFDPVTGNSQQMQVSRGSMEAELVLAQPRDRQSTPILRLYTIRLDGRTRLSLVDRRPAGDLKRYPTNHLVALVLDPEARKRVRAATRDAFGLYLVLDTTEMLQLGVRLSEREPADEEEEIGLVPRALRFQEAARPIEHFSDGIRAFAGLLIAVQSLDYRVMLVDEPEAFLHPTLVRRLGRLLAELSHARQGHVLAATHSADFLAGVLQSGVSANILRLTYRQGVPTARLLPADVLAQMIRDPALRYAGTLNALFYTNVVVTEGDSDQVLYQEINERLDKLGPHVDDALFLNARTKQNVRRVIQPLRNLGIPAAAIVDLDIIKDADMSDLLHAAQMPRELINTYGQLRGEVYAKFTQFGLDPKNGGVFQLTGGARDSAMSLVSSLAEYGVFLVPVGDLEHWLSDLGIPPVRKSEWLSQILTKLGSDPTSTSYVSPSQADIWQFLRGVARWMTNPERKGLAA